MSSPSFSDAATTCPKGEVTNASCNGTVDHNLLRMPTEPLGFSGEFKLSLFSGVPDFDDLKFEFSAKPTSLAIAVE